MLVPSKIFNNTLPVCRNGSIAAWAHGVAIDKFQASWALFEPGFLAFSLAIRSLSFFASAFQNCFLAVFHDNSPNGSIQLCMLGENKYYLHLLTQSDPDSQTDPHQDHNSWRSCNAAQFHGRNTSFAGGRTESFVRATVC